MTALRAHGMYGAYLRKEGNHMSTTNGTSTTHDSNGIEFKEGDSLRHALNSAAHYGRALGGKLRRFGGAL